ncbi:uncharacterized protein LOC109853044 isoform X2 [Pseudomyrmex gracilis]|uniref:uncharacterized protein LOC109853044 isoform X2 n=1 Tax=Pseudomyrmex gracilis TaxID=219809 RepID=UPI000994E8DD|nr:uncharacterized protein LOC109853044 isoform X2 [Pseudomyrmex gracilis]
MYKFTLRQDTSHYNHEVSRVTMIRRVMQRDSTNQDHQNLAEANEIYMTARQIPSFIELLECATLCLLVRLVSTDAEGIIDLMDNDTTFVKAIINLLQSYDVYSNKDFVYYFSAFLNAVLDRIQTRFESNWKNHLLELGNKINEELSLETLENVERVAAIYRADNMHPTPEFQQISVYLRTLLNLKCMQLTQTNNDVLRQIFVVNEIFLKPLIKVVIKIFRKHIKVQQHVTTFSQWMFIGSWLSVTIFIRRLDLYNVESLREPSKLFHENSSSFLKTMDIMYKILSEFTNIEQDSINLFYQSKIIIEAVRKTSELLVLFCDNIGVPLTLTIMLLSIFCHIDKLHNETSEDEKNKLVEDYLSESLLYWTFILDKCSWLHILGILDLCPTDVQVFVLKKAVNSSVLPVPRKTQLMKVYNYLLI